MIRESLRQGMLVLACVACLCLCSLGQTSLAQAPSRQGLATLRTFPSAEAAASTLTEAMRNDDDKLISAILGGGWRDFVPGTREDEDAQRKKYLDAWDEAHKIVPQGDTKAVVEVGTTGFIMPIPIVRDGGVWRFDVDAGRRELQARYIGRNELTAVQALLALVDAQRDYAALDPMKTGVATYARRLLSTPGKKDGLYWETGPGEPPSPLGALFAKAQPGEAAAAGYYGYRYRLLYRQGAAAAGGAYEYVVNGRMIGGFAAIAWPVRYGETGVMTFMVGHTGEVYERDLGPETERRAGEISSFQPGTDWQKSDATP